MGWILQMDSSWMNTTLYNDQHCCSFACTSFYFFYIEKSIQCIFIMFFSFLLTPSDPPYLLLVFILICFIQLFPLSILFPANLTIYVFPVWPGYNLLSLFEGGEFTLQLEIVPIWENGKGGFSSVDYNLSSYR